MDWPATLPIPLASGYSYNDVFEIIQPDSKLGFTPMLRRGQINSPKPVNISLLLNFHEFALFDWFINRKLAHGAKRLVIPLKLDDALIQGNGKITSVSPSTEGDHWRVSMTLEIMPPVIDKPIKARINYSETVQLSAYQAVVFQTEFMGLCNNHNLQIITAGSLNVSATTLLDMPFVPVGTADGPVICRLDGLFQAFKLLSSNNMTLHLLGNRYDQ